MSDIILVSNLATPSNRVLQALDNAGLHVVDLLTLDVFEIHRRTQLSVIDVQNLVRDVIIALIGTIEGECIRTAEERSRELAFLTTGDEKLDDLLGGGIPTGSLTEVSGERYIHS
jgi:DNA repair protein RAD57